MSDITSLFQRVWRNIWKENFLWLFSGLYFISQIIIFISPNQNGLGLLLSCLGLFLFFIYIYLLYAGNIGVTYVASRVIVGNPVNIQMVFRAIRNFFWRILTATLLFSILFGLFVLLSVGVFFILFHKEFPRFSDFPKIYFIVSIPLSLFAAPRYFIFSEIIIRDSGVWKSMENAWDLFIGNFFVLAVIGIIMLSIFYIANISIGALIILFQNNFDFSALSKFNFFLPRLSFLDNKLIVLYDFLVFTVIGTVLNTFSISIFTLAYLKYRGQIE